MGAKMTARELGSMFRSARRVVAFTGAGMSTDSGVPDFRSPGGVWSKMKPITYQEFIGDLEKRREAWTRAFSGSAGWTGAAPNSGHFALARLVAEGKLSSIITQNVDNLHQTAETPADKVIELHGNASYATCLDCGRRYELEELSEGFVERGVLPTCDECGGVVKVATISFGQAMPEGPMRRAADEALSCDLFIVFGSSLVVYPAAELPLLAKRQGAKLVIVNREPTPQDEIADLVLHDSIGAVLDVIAPTTRH
jgi:NAD-dependent deacetylase